MKKQKLANQIVPRWTQSTDLSNVQACFWIRFLIGHPISISLKMKTGYEIDGSDGHIGSFSPAYGDQYPDIIITDESYDSSYDLEDIDVQYT